VYRARDIVNCGNDNDRFVVVSYNMHGFNQGLEGYQ